MEKLFSFSFRSQLLKFEKTGFSHLYNNALISKRNIFLLEKEFINIKKENNLMMSFEDFKKKNVESFDDFIKSSIVEEVCKRDMEKIKKAYEKYCASQYSSYKHQFYGGNPSTIV